MGFNSGFKGLSVRITTECLKLKKSDIIQSDRFPIVILSAFFTPPPPVPGAQLLTFRDNFSVPSSSIRPSSWTASRLDLKAIVRVEMLITY